MGKLQQKKAVIPKLIYETSLEKEHLLVFESLPIWHVAKLGLGIDSTLLILVSLSSLLIDLAVYQLHTRKQMYLHNITALLSKVRNRIWPNARCSIIFTNI